MTQSIDIDIQHIFLFNVAIVIYFSYYALIRKKNGGDHVE